MSRFGDEFSDGERWRISNPKILSKSSKTKTQATEGLQGPIALFLRGTTLAMVPQMKNTNVTATAACGADDWLWTGIWSRDFRNHHGLLQVRSLQVGLRLLIGGEVIAGSAEGTH